MDDKAELVRQLMDRALAESFAKFEAKLEQEWAEHAASALPDPESSPDINSFNPR